MPQVHLVGITPDHLGLVLSPHPHARHGDLVLPIDERLVGALAAAQRLRTRAESASLVSAALPTRREPAPEEAGTPGPRLSPRVIQSRLRAGETVAQIARASGVEESWIARFAAPVLAEQAQVLDAARAVTFAKGRALPSALALGRAVAANALERGATLTAAELEAAWSVRRVDGGWCIGFSFPQKGRRQRAEWHFEPATGELTARGKIAAELAYREPGQPEPVAPAPEAARPASEPFPDIPVVMADDDPEADPWAHAELEVLDELDVLAELEVLDKLEVLEMFAEPAIVSIPDVPDVPEVPGESAIVSIPDLPGASDCLAEPDLALTADEPVTVAGPGLQPQTTATPGTAAGPVTPAPGSGGAGAGQAPLMRRPRSTPPRRPPS